VDQSVYKLYWNGDRGPRLSYLVTEAGWVYPKISTFSGIDAYVYLIQNKVNVGIDTGKGTLIFG